MAWHFTERKNSCYSAKVSAIGDTSITIKETIEHSERAARYKTFP